MEAIHPSDTNNLRFPKGDTTRYMTNIKIIQYDEAWDLASTEDREKAAVRFVPRQMFIS